MKKTARRLHIKAGPLILFLIFCIVGGIVGIAVNNHYYAAQRAGFDGAPTKQTR